MLSCGAGNVKNTTMPGHLHAGLVKRLYNLEGCDVLHTPYSLELVLDEYDQ
jgi:hypothetical protein